MRVLNLYAGLGGNRKLWQDVDVTAVEKDERIADVYRKLYPSDLVVVGDAHEYLLNHYDEFDFIWSSPPCQSHSRMIRGGRNRRPRYIDMSLYQEILFLKNDFEGLWIVENVAPFYAPLVRPTAEIGRHIVWCNFNIGYCAVPKFDDFINKQTVNDAVRLKEWLGIDYDGNIYYEDNHCPTQVLRNCVHPLIGKAIFDFAVQRKQTDQAELILE